MIKIVAGTRERKSEVNCTTESVRVSAYPLGAATFVAIEGHEHDSYHTGNEFDYIKDIKRIGSVTISGEHIIEAFEALLNARKFSISEHQKHRVLAAIYANLARTSDQ